MKIQNAFFPLFIVAILLVLNFSCSKEEAFLSAESQPEELEFRAPPIKVFPSGDASGITDADAIEAALNSPGAKKVVLQAGTFYINRTISAPVGFKGAFGGQGAGTTIIQGVGTSGSPFGGDLIYEQLNPAPVFATSFFYFPDPNKLRIKDLSMSLPSGFIAEPSDFDGNSNLNAFLTVKSGGAAPDVVIKNVQLQGTDAAPGSPDWYLSQPNFGTVILGNRDAPNFPQPSHSGGDIKVQQCLITKTAYQALVVEVLKSAKVSIINNAFSETKQVNIRFLDGSDVKVANNGFNTNSWGSLVITQEEALGFGPITGSPSKIVVQNNQIVSNGFLGIEIGAIPFPNSATFDIKIEDNTITKGAGPVPIFSGNLAGIGIYTGHSDALIQNNTLLGDAEYGVFLLDADNCQLNNNSTSGFTPAVADYGLIGPSDNNATTTTDTSTAIDEGTNNTFVGPITIL